MIEEEISDNITLRKRLESRLGINDPDLQSVYEIIDSLKSRVEGLEAKYAVALDLLPPFNKNYIIEMLVQAGVEGEEDGK